MLDQDRIRRLEAIAAAEGADLAVVLPAALLHELFNYPKNRPDSPRSGDVCAEAAAAVLQAGETLAAARTAFLKQFLAQLEREPGES